MEKETRVEMKSPIELAFIGDAVYEMLVRGHIVRGVDTNGNTLHRMAVSYVCAEAQSAALEAVDALLTDGERDVVRRGRNASKAAVPRNGTPASYRRSTGLEALFGYLYLSGQNERMEELFAAIVRARAE